MKRRMGWILGAGAFVALAAAGVELSPEMKKLLPLIAQEAVDVLKDWGIEVKPKAEERAVNYGIVAEESVREEME